MTDEKITPQRKIDDPIGNFSTPEDVVADDTLSVKQKQDVLVKWEQDAIALSVATEEGMSGGDPSRLDEVLDAQSELSSAQTERPSSPTTAG